MLQRIAAAMPFWAFYVESKLGKTGLTVTVDVYQKALGSAATQIITGASATEVGGGYYTYELAAGSVVSNGSYMAVFKTATSTVDAQWIPSAWFTPVWLTTVGAATVTFTNPLATDGTITLVHGDDYFAVDGRSIDPIFSTAPSLTGATVTLAIRRADRAVNDLSITGTVLSATQLRFEITAAQSLRLTPGADYAYDFQAVLSGSAHVTTLQKGTVTVTQDYAAP